MSDIDIAAESEQIAGGVKARQLINDPWFTKLCDELKQTAFEAFLVAKNDEERRNCQARTLAVELVLKQLRVEDSRSHEAMNKRSNREKAAEASRKAGQRQ